jgi:3-oxoacyl-[acyl-carrier-protein] synthase II
VRRAQRHQVAVTGIGIVSALGHEIEEFWRNCIDGASPCTPVPSHWSVYYKAKSKFWSPLPLPPYETAGIRRIELLSYDPACLNAMFAGTMALRNANLGIAPYDEKGNRYRLLDVDRRRSGVFIGTGLGCISSSFQNYVPHLLAPLRGDLESPDFATLQSEQQSVREELLEYLRESPRVSQVASLKSMGSSISAALSIRYGFTGPNQTTLGACAAGLMALCQGFESIASGQLDLALVGGSEYYGDRAGGVFMAFDRINTLTTGDCAGSPANCPFDESRTGFLFSQGAACVLVLEKLDQAIARGAPILAKVHNAGMSSDAYSMVAISEEDNSIESLLEEVLRDSEISPSDIDYVNAHGTGTVQNDAVEARIVRRVFKDHPFVNSTKSLLGHTIGACGAIEAAVVIQSLRTGKLHPSMGLCEPVEPLNFVRSRTAADIRLALTQNFGFGGHNAVAVFAK